MVSLGFYAKKKISNLLFRHKSKVSTQKIHPLLSISHLRSQATHMTVPPSYVLTFPVGADYGGKITVPKKNGSLGNRKRPFNFTFKFLK